MSSPHSNTMRTLLEKYKEKLKTTLRLSILSSISKSDLPADAKDKCSSIVIDAFDAFVS